MPEIYIQHSQTARSLIVLLNNISELIVISNDRKGALEVLDCFEKYAETHSFPLPKEKVSNFKRVCLDSRPITLNSIIKSIAMVIIEYDRKRQLEKQRSENIEKIKKLKQK
jgi:hypothetical protein